MKELLGGWMSEIISFVVGAICGYGVSIKVNSRRSATTQTGNVAGGSIVGGDMKTGGKK